MKQWKIVENETCSEEIDKLSSVKNSFWANHATKKTQNNPIWKLFKWNNVSEKIDWLHSRFLEIQGRNR